MTYHADDRVTLYQGDCREVMASLEPCSVDAIVTDPPYELGFMGKAWDAAGVTYDVQTWAAALRVLKPGGHLVAFGAPRTYHRLACAIEDAGFEVRDCLMWLYGSGFPKSLNVEKATGCADWQGWGTALKPAYEPIILARRPLAGTVAANVLEYGTGGLNIDGCRIGSEPRVNGAGSLGAHGIYGRMERNDSETTTSGRWPANVVLDEEAAALLDAQAGERGGGVGVRGGDPEGHGIYNAAFPRGDMRTVGYGDSGGPSRFMYTAKASRSEREAGLDGFDPQRRSDGRHTEAEYPKLRTSTRRNDHPTVKPVSLMRWLCRLITPPGGVVLDPFMGSGSTRVAALAEGMRFVGIDLEPRYVDVAGARAAQAGFTLEP